MYYSTETFNKSLIEAITNFMVANKVEKLPFDFAMNNNTSSSEIARKFYEAGYRYFTVNENNELVLHGVLDDLGKDFVGKTFEWIIVPTPIYDHPTLSFHSPSTIDMVNMVRIAYDTIVNRIFTGLGVKTYC